MCRYIERFNSFLSQVLPEAMIVFDQSVQLGGWSVSKGTGFIAIEQSHLLGEDIISLGIAVTACEKGAQWQLALHFLQQLWSLKTNKRGCEMRWGWVFWLV